MKYIAAGSVITNRIWYKDGRLVDGLMGGHGLYGYEGMAFGSGDACFVSTVGPDFDEWYGKWFDDNGFSREGLSFRCIKTLYNELVYMEDGTFVEYSIYSPEISKHDESVASVRVDDYAKFLPDCKGMYLMILPKGEDFKRFIELKKKYGFKLMWEYTPGKLLTEGKEAVFDFINDHADIYSLNRPESYQLFGTTNEEDTIKKIMELGRPCYYRVGSKGAYMIKDGKSAFVPVVNIVPHDQEIDPTGCGNSSTAAAGWGFFEDMDILMNCIWGNVVAGYNVRQYGPYPEINEKVRKEAMDKAKELYMELSK